jgi:hypothetical protein
MDESWWKLTSESLHETLVPWSNENKSCMRVDWILLIKRAEILKSTKSAWERGLSKYDGQEARQTSKLQNRRPLFDAELYLNLHKSFVSTLLNIIPPGCTFHLSYP